MSKIEMSNSKYEIVRYEDGSYDVYSKADGQNVTASVDNDLVKDLIGCIGNLYSKLDDAINADSAVISSPIGDLPVNSEGLRRAVDEISKLREENKTLAYDINRNISPHICFCR